MAASPSTSSSAEAADGERKGAAAMLIDTFGRVATGVRVPLTDRCNRPDARPRLCHAPLLRHLRPHPTHRGRPSAHLPLRPGGARPARDAALRSLSGTTSTDRTGSEAMGRVTERRRVLRIRDGAVGTRPDPVAARHARRRHRMCTPTPRSTAPRKNASRSSRAPRRPSLQLPLTTLVCRKAVGLPGPSFGGSGHPRCPPASAQRHALRSGGVAERASTGIPGLFLHDTKWPGTERRPVSPPRQPNLVSLPGPSPILAWGD
ncbi:hypothetical protein OK006_10112 [Actinobacteria bacterium OK006]|nr:hypothetical protein OK006_10112 [Actinobacteria bacterium OK006]